ncbi:type IV secretory system conjugative DNA transfer family protein [Bradyrhizobium diazoefficiens]|uniref:type IV secretory system conjugative DNA transfer family protein n=1 Tax=Bradyrhizobium diazoefficiens TaxID=1355477 RepID=UPI000D72EA47|nr:type IV secretory system conjugative DNA transfer family protein [Bradyrhizobium diazoefficiens]AWO92421.1 type IV secretory system conjugative DNA transfer family protein [Bradyrhizobium diazoefficiens]
MGMFTSPDRPASVLHRLVGIRDTEPPITDEEYALHQRFVDLVQYAPRDIAERANCPEEVNRKTRAAVRRFVSDPALPGLIEMLERAKAQSLADGVKRQREQQAAEAQAEERRQQTKLAAVAEFHDNQLNELKFELAEFQHLIGDASMKEATLRIAQDSQSEWTRNTRNMNLNFASRGDGPGAALLGQIANYENQWRDKSAARGVAKGMVRFTIRRTLVSMTEAERATLRMADVLAAVGRLTADDHLRIAVPIVWNGSDCAHDFHGAEFRERAAMLEVLKQLIAASLGNSAGAREHLTQSVRDALDERRGLPADQRAVVERYLFSGNRWMSEAEGQRALARGDLSASALRIGGFPGGSSDLLYDLRESLITVAPSGSGKSQAHVLRNLLHVKAPAVVLDIKGEMSAASRQWREREVGKTYVFSPREPDRSFHYNPLDDISTDPDQAWEDARTVAELMFKPTARTRDDAYFENGARDMLTTALVDVALSQKGAKRNMTSVLSLLYTSLDEEILAWCKRLDKLKNVQLSLEAKALRGMPVKQRESLLDTARRQVEIWKSPSILKITSDTTFDGASLRSENATVYLKVTLEDVERYASVLRLLVGQLLLKLYRVGPEADAPVVTFFLDELPRLGRLDVIEQSLDMGRGYAVRLWLFCQNLGQLQNAYPNATGMMSNCAIRCFMNPDEDAARWLSENLGTRHGLLDGARKPLVEAHQLTGPEFANQVIVFSRGQLPARLDKKPAYADAACLERMARAAEPAPAAPEPIPEVSAAEPPQTSTPAKASDSAGPSPTSPTDEAKSEAINWDEVRNTAPASPISAPVPVERSALVNWKHIVLGLVAVAIVVVAVRGFSNKSAEIEALSAEKASLSAALNTAEGDKQRFERERAGWKENLSAAEAARERFRSEAESARRVLALEQKEHAVTRERLASAQRDLETEKARAAAHAAVPAPPPPAAPTVATPQVQTLPVQTQSAPQSQPAPAPNASVFPDSTKTTLPASLLPSSQAANSNVTDCDTLAGNPNDPRRVAAGVKYPDLKRNAAAAISACDVALQASPGELRFKYQKARALYAANDLRARSMFDELMNAGYPSAFDNAAQYLIREGRMQQAEGLLRRGAQLRDPDAIVTLADAIKAGSMPARFMGEDLVLYGIAAELGHQGARNYVQQSQSQ